MEIILADCTLNGFCLLKVEILRRLALLRMTWKKEGQHKDEGLLAPYVIKYRRYEPKNTFQIRVFALQEGKILRRLALFGMTRKRER